MTSFAFVLGVVPLVLAKGAGAEMRRTLGIAVFSGMLGVTAFGIFFTPVFYAVVRWFTDKPAVPTADTAGEINVNGSPTRPELDGHSDGLAHPNIEGATHRDFGKQATS
jgi:hypothetical protein